MSRLWLLVKVARDFLCQDCKDRSRSLSEIIFSRLRFINEKYLVV